MRAELLGHEDTRSARRKLGRIGFDALVAQFALENAQAVFQATAISNAAGRRIVDVRDKSKTNPDKVFYIEREEYEDIYILNGRQMYFYSSKVKEIDGKPFDLDLGGMRFQPPSDDLWLQYLRTGGTEVIGFGSGGIKEKRLEDYIVSALMDCNDVSYDEHADLLYDLAGQTVAHLQSYLSDEEDVHKVLRMHRRDIAGLIHARR